MAFFGMRGSGDFAANQRPENWDQTIMREFPNGDAPLTALMSMFGKDTTNDPVFHWWTKRVPEQGGAVTNIYIDAGLGTAYVYGTHQAAIGISGGTIYVKVAEVLAKEFRAGHDVVLRDTDQYDVDVAGEVTSVVYNGANSYMSIKLDEADDNANDSTTYNLSTVDRVMVIGNSNAESGAIPRAIGYSPVEYSNYTRIFRTPLEISRTAKKTFLRTGPAYQEAKKDALQMHSIEREKALIFSVLASTTGANGKPKRKFDGVRSFIRKNATTADSRTAAGSMNDFRLRTDYSGDTWIDKGEDWIEEQLEYLSTYAPSDMIGFCGAGTITGLTRLAKINGNIQFTPGPNQTYGMTFTTWLNAQGTTIHLKKHPLMAREASTKNSMLILAPKNVKMTTLDPTQYLTDRAAKGTDGDVEEFLTEEGPKFFFPDQFMWLDGIGKDNNL